LPTAPFVFENLFILFAFPFLIINYDIKTISLEYLAISWAAPALGQAAASV
jgi:hypothetical protein